MGTSKDLETPVQVTVACDLPVIVTVGADQLNPWYSVGNVNMMSILDDGIHLAQTVSFDELDRCIAWPGRPSTAGSTGRLFAAKVDGNAAVPYPLRESSRS